MNSLTLGGGSGEAPVTLESASGSGTVGFRLAVTTTVTILSDGHLNMQGSIQGTGKVGDSLMVAGAITNDGTLTFQNTSYISTSGLTNNNLIIADFGNDAYGANDIIGNVTNNATGEIQIEGHQQSRHGNIHITGNLTNSGLVYLFTTATSSGGIGADLNVSGTFTNNPSGTFVDSADAWDSIRSLTVGSLDNQGTFISRSNSNSYNFGITTASVAGTFINSGQMNIAESMNISNVGTFDNTGTINIDTTKTLTLHGFNNAGTYTGTGEQFQGNGTLSLTDIALNVSTFPALDSLGLTMSGASSLTLTDSLIVYRSLTGGIITASGVRNQGTLTIGSGGSLSSPAKDIINNGTLILSGGDITGNVTNNDSLSTASTSSTITGTLTNMADAGFRLDDLTMDGDITNHGYVALASKVPGGAGSTLGTTSMTNYQFINSFTGIIEGETGYDANKSASFSFGANLVNAGTFNSNFKVIFSGGDHSNSNTIRINQGAAGMYQSSNGQFAFQSGATFTNTGTVFMDTTASLYISGTTYQGSTGTLDGTGMLSLVGGAHAYLGSKFVVKDDGLKLIFSGSTIYVDSLINQATWTARGNKVYADSVIINQGKLILEPSSGPIYSAWYGPLINQDTLIVEPFPQYTAQHVTANEVLGGPVVNETGAVLLVQSSTHGHATLTVDSSFTNHGTLTLANDPAATYNYYANLNVNKGWLTNSIDAVFDGLAYSTVNADLDNQGTFNVTPNTSFTLYVFKMEKNPERILNSGTINISAGDYFRIDYLDSLVNTGTITIDAASTVQFYGSYDPSVSGIFPTPEATFTFEGGGSLSNAGILHIKYLSVDLGAKWVIGSTENVTLYHSQVVTDSLINEGYLTMQNVSITGEVVNRDTIWAEFNGASFGSTLVNEAGAYIKGGGTYLDVDSAFTNHGDLELTTLTASSYGVSVDVRAGNLVNSPTGIINTEVGVSTRPTPQHKLYSNLINQGSITLSGPTLLYKVDASHTNSGTVQVDTTLTIAGSGLFTNLADGIVSGQGTIDVTDTDVAFINAGTIAPGGSPGVLAVDGDLTLEESSVIAIEIGGPDPSTGYDQLNITGNAALAGSLMVSIIDQYSPPDGTTFLPLSYGTSSGVFESLTTQGDGAFLSAHIRDTDVYLSASISGGNSWPYIGRIADITALEDTTLAITLQAFDPDESDVLTFSAVSDTPAVAVAIDVDTLKITPQLNWNGTAKIEVIVSDGSNLKDTTDFVLTLTPVQDAPLAFDLIQPVQDSTVVIDQNNLSIQFYLLWNQAEDPDGDNVYYDVVFTDSLDLIPARAPGRYTGVYWYLSEIKTVMESNGYPTMSGTWTVLARDSYDNTTYAANGPFNLTFVNGTLGIDGGEGLPTTFALHQNYPNPFNPSTTIKFDVPEATELMVVVYDLLGRKVITLANGPVQPGYHRVIWSGKTADGSEVPTGMYIARLVTPEYTKSIKMVLLK
ncbi:MAG: T9SS type A sorting domain-containing protein [Candidatus Neomarinimicrobiota bacterium]